MSGDDHSGNDASKKEKEECVQFKAGGNEGGNSSREPEVRVSCRSPERDRKCAMMFELSNGSVIYPRYEASLLEEYYLECAFPEARNRIRFCLIFVAICSLIWGVYARALGVNSANGYLGGGLAGLAVCLIAFGLTFLRIFKKLYRVITVVWAIIIIVLTLAMYAIYPAGLTYVMMMGMCLKLLLIIYTVVPVPLFVCILLGILLSLPFEILLCTRYGFTYLVAPRIIIQIAIHIIGIHLHLMSQVRRRSAFIKLCQSARIKKELKMEQKANREMIQSLMPDKVANEVMAGEDSKRERRHRDEDGGFADSESEDQGPHSGGSDSDSDSEAVDAERPNEEQAGKQSLVTFRKFHVSQMHDVSILYADIVGFTKMSSNKTATHLVTLLNDLFGRFDQLCEANGNEKIATLGDCYYCVAGCPNECADHAERCVEMGRSMCLAIQQFDEDHNEEVNMRVGVHTGTVICGIVGTRRFKFDVWSNDVNLANEMESSGQAGKVHISESTLEFVKDLYDVEPGEPVPDIRKIKVLVEYFDDKQKCYAIKHDQEQAEIETYFIVDRKDRRPPKSLKDKEGETKDVNATEEEDGGKVVDESTGLREASATNDQTEDKKAANGDERRGSSASDLVETMRGDKEKRKAFYFPPISPLTLNFASSTERKYRRLGVKPPRRQTTKTTLSTPRVSRLADSLVFIGIILLTTIACFAADGGYLPVQIVVLVITLLVSVFLLFPLIVDRCCSPSPGFLAFYARIFSWYPRNIVGAIVLVLPALAVLATLMICSLRAQVIYTFGFAISLLFSIIVFAIFTMYSFWTKLAMSLITAVIGCILIFAAPASFCGEDGVCGPGSRDNVSINYGPSNSTTPKITVTTIAPTFVPPTGCNVSTIVPVFEDSWPYFSYELLIALVLLLIIVNFLSRKFDVSHRLCFNCDLVTLQEKAEINKAKKQADWLLENIIPNYIINDLKNNQKYSKHMINVGVIFATLSNFSQFYDEQFKGGQEMLRVLNEIFADFEHLLAQSKFKDVEKIKTIGACFMAASGLNAKERDRNNEKLRAVTGDPEAESVSHLVALMDFAIALLETIEEFNKQIFNFDFELKIGYNIGEVTAGVIGTTKLLYDIWGDTVNVASRMYSTGEKGRIQVTKQIADQLQDEYEFEYRDIVEVKGKGKMETYLLKCKKSKKEEAN